MKAIKVFFQILILFNILFGCKENSSTESIPVPSEQITKSWQLVKALRFANDSSKPLDVTNQMDFTYLKFQNDGTYTSSVQNGKWEFDSPKEKILFDKGSHNSFAAVILKLTADTLRIKMYMPDNGIPFLYELTFTENKNILNTSAETNFEVFWKEFDQRYSFFEIKKINWDSLYSIYRPRINSGTTEIELFQILSSLLAELKDGHADLTTPLGRYSYTDWYTKHPANYLGKEITAKYLIKNYGTLADGYIQYGKTEDNIGYIYIGPNLSGDINVWSQAIDVVLDSLKDSKGIIVDIRNNSGGSDSFGNTVAGRFTELTRIYSYVRYRSGSKHSDFTDFSPCYLSPQGSKKFLKPVVLLTNRKCFSSTEGTTLMFKSIPNVIVIGDTTGGGSANPITLKLPNGWIYRVSRWIQYTSEKEVFEGKGLAPDIPVWITKTDSIAGKDVILERAIQYLK